MTTTTTSTATTAQPAIVNAKADTRSVTIALNQLFLSPGNVRKVEPSGIAELAQMIAAQGLLNPLIVTLSDDHDGPIRYGVEAGGRRLRALQLLAENGAIPADWPIECKLIDSDSALEVSLTENISIEGMHPADEFDAYHAMAKKGMPVPVIANKFGVTELHVQRRLKMAGIAPELFAHYRQDAMTLDQLMAFAVTNDHAVQLQVWNSLPTYGRSAYTIKKMILQDEVSAGDKRLKIVSLDEYKAAGGEVRVDLFSDNGEEKIINPTLLDELIAKRLETIGEELLADGWSWVDVRNEPVYSYDLRSKYVQHDPEPRDPTEAEQSQLDALKASLKEVDEKIAAIEDDEDYDGDEYDALTQTSSDLTEKIEELESTFVDTTYPNKANEGVIVFVDHSGVDYHYGLSEKTAGSAGTSGSHSTGTSVGGKTKTEFSEKLTLNMTSHLTAALQASMIANPNVALAAAACRFAISLLDHGGYENPVKISLTTAMHGLKDNSDTVATSKGYVATQEKLDLWRNQLPEDKATWLAWFIAQPQATSLDMIVLGTALTTTAVSSGSVNRATGLIKAVNLDMAEFWEATPDTFLNHVPKPKLMEAVTQATSEADAEPMTKMKKGEAISFAAAKLAGKRWLPSVLKF